MNDWVESIHQTAPFYVSSNNYTKIAVDRVQAADGCMHNILLLATGMFQLERNTRFFLVFYTFVLATSGLSVFLLIWLVIMVCNVGETKRADHTAFLGEYARKCLCAVPTDSGKIHKVLEAGEEPFIISETQLSSRSTVQSMKLDSKKVF